MSKQRYVYTTTCGKMYIAAAIYKPIAIITDHSKNAAMKQYLIDNNETLNLTISKDSKFIRTNIIWGEFKCAKTF